ncbi:AAA family ATPase [Lutispora sp.]|uniref:AAA family ATPase n=1 Tax=Lutispora sp. TaxID=2828727 RepID=UPI000EDFD11C|nr:AAA family ATPase [Lutispora sp.]MEA4961761.1 AAA family ATPase [Lutispora sp.]HCJ58389.1 ATPase [Clostridiaceae bacterium]
MNYKEHIIGAVAAIIVFLSLLGFDILPLIFLIGFAGAIYFITDSKLLKVKSSSVGEGRKDSSISFNDIGGQEIAKNELREALEFIKSNDKLKALGIRPLKGILLNGPPGTGKTLLAKAAAQYTNSIFLSASGSEFVEMYVGVGAKRVRQLFTQAKQAAKRMNRHSAVIFIDEIEVLGGKRGQNHSHQEHDQTLNELLVQMDGISSDDEVKVLVIGATNRSDMLDSALLRPGRFDRIVKVDLPDKKGRAHILKLHTRNKPLSAEVEIEAIARDTFGFSGAQLESVANEAAILAMRDESKEISSVHFKNAIEKVMMGEKLDRLPSVDEKLRIAIHESGHALIGELLFPHSVASVNVASRSNALGYVRNTQEDDMFLYTCDYLNGRIAVSLAGALAEEVLLSSRSTGASSDFQNASDLARHIVYGGMSELGIISAEDLPKEKLHNAISSILGEVEKSTLSLLNENIQILKDVSSELLDKETLSGDELRALIKKEAA